MTLFGLIIALVIFGVLLYLVQFIPMDAKVRQIIRVVAIVVLVLWLVLQLADHPSVAELNPRLW